MAQALQHQEFSIEPACQTAPWLACQHKGYQEGDKGHHHEDSPNLSQVLVCTQGSAVDNNNNKQLLILLPSYFPIHTALTVSALTPVISAHKDGQYCGGTASPVSVQAQEVYSRAAGAKPATRNSVAMLAANEIPLTIENAFLPLSFLSHILMAALQHTLHKARTVLT